MNNFYLKNRHLFEEDDEVPYIHQAEKLYQLIPRLKYDQNIPRNLFREREKEIFAEPPKNVFSQNARNLLGNNYNDVYKPPQDSGVYGIPKQNYPTQRPSYPIQRDNSPYRRDHYPVQRESYPYPRESHPLRRETNSMIDARYPSYNQPKIEEKNRYMSPPKNYEKYPNHPNHPSNQYNPITHNNEQSRLGSYTTEPKPRTRGYNQRNSSSEPPLRNESYLIGVGDPYSKQINNIPTYMPKKDNAPFATDADQLSQLLMKNERQSPAPVRKISDDFLRHDTENNINESPNYFASQLNKSPKKITEAITESKKHNIFPHDAFMMLKRRMFNIRGDLNTLDDSPFPREKIFLVSHLQGRADQLEALGNKKTVQESLERRILVSVNTERRGKLRALLQKDGVI